LPTQPIRRFAVQSRFILVALAIIGIAVWIYVAAWPTPLGEVRAIFSSAEAFRVWIDGFGAWAPLVFFLAEVVQVIVAPIPGIIFPAVGTIAFGPGTALVLTLGGALVGSALGFGLTRRWGRPLAVRLLGQETFDRYARISAVSGGLWLFLALLVPAAPGDALCVLAGLSPISLRRFLLVTTLGRLAGTALSIYLVDNGIEGTLSGWAIALAAAVLAGGMLLISKYRGRLEAWLLRHGDAHRAGRAEEPARDRR
jgi:uncharacterized membrane protein YdjX (TVP38/TMEM64 family)